MKYLSIKDGQWFRPSSRGHKLMCCDCGLVHTVDFRVVQNRIEMRARRDNRATAASRVARRRKAA